MATRKPHTPIPPSTIEHENTGTFSSVGRQFKVVGFDLDTNQAVVKNDRKEHRLMTNHEITVMTKTP